MADQEAANQIEENFLKMGPNVIEYTRGMCRLCTHGSSFLGKFQWLGSSKSLSIDWKILCAFTKGYYGTVLVSRLFLLIHNGDRTERSPIRSAVIRVIIKIVLICRNRGHEQLHHICCWNRIFLFENCVSILCKMLLVCLCKLI